MHFWLYSLCYLSRIITFTCINKKKNFISHIYSRLSSIKSCPVLSTFLTEYSDSCGTLITKSWKRPCVGNPTLYLCAKVGGAGLVFRQSLQLLRYLWKPAQCKPLSCLVSCVQPDHLWAVLERSEEAPEDHAQLFVTARGIKWVIWSFCLNLI